MPFMTPPMPCSRTPKWIWRPAGSSRSNDAVALELGAGVAGEVGAAADEAGHDVERRRRGTLPLALRVATFSPGVPRRAAPRPSRAGRAPARQASTRLAVAVAVGEALLPRLARGAAPAPGLAVEVEHVVGHLEGLVGRQAQDLLGDRGSRRRRAGCRGPRRCR